MVRAKFSCESVEEFINSKRAHLVAIYSTDTKENEDFTKATPSGKIEIMISKDARAVDYFIPGNDYYLDFTNVNGDQNLHARSDEEILNSL